ncbi:TPA: ead/Ea22-like family protein [Klebsiella oxytoca]|nr:ead/Ea22-like family protein [Klebsiella oxytoca]
MTDITELTAEKLEEIRQRYRPTLAPKCHICGVEMTIQRMSASRITYGCAGAIYDETGCHYAEGRSLADDHYAESRITVVDVSDPDVLAMVEALEKAQTINAAAEKLVRCKGRYHSEQNYRALAALFGVTTPDLPPLDSESSAVTVKLTDINEFLAEVHDKTLNRAFRLLAEGVRAGDVAAMRAAGIKVEGE